MISITDEQLSRFKSLHKQGELAEFSDAEVKEIASGVVNIFLTLLKADENDHGAHQRYIKE